MNQMPNAELKNRNGEGVKRRIGVKGLSPVHRFPDSYLRQNRDRLGNPCSEFCILVLLLLTVLVFWSCSRDDYSGKVDSITLGTQLLEPGVPVLIAEDRQYFGRNGLDVTLKNYDTGLRAVNAMLKGEIDISSPVADYVLAGKALQHENIQTIGCLDRVDWAFVVGRKDRGVKVVSDLKGKKIGVMRGTMTEFYLGRFLELHGIKMENVTLVNITKNAQAFDEIIGGHVDAVISVQPVVNAAKNQLGSNAAVWPAQSSQPFYALLICKNDWVRQHPKLIERFLRAMNQAEEYIARHPDRAKAIVRKRLGFADDEVDRVWSRNIFSLSLDQSLVAAMEDEARWMIKNNLTKEKAVPDFTNYIYTDGLKAIKPEAVNIIR